MEMVSTRAYDFEYVPVGYEDGMGPDEEFGPEPYWELGARRDAT
jgi:hypothetical protein